MLKIVRRGETWYAHGTVNGQRVRQSLGTSDKKQAEFLRTSLEERIWKRHTFGEVVVRTFEEAALSYLEQGGEGRFLEPILRYFKGQTLSSIAPGDVRSAAIALLPNASNATRNRQVLTPTKAIINHGASLNWCARIAVKSFPVPKSRKHKPVDRDWLDTFMAQADQDGMPHLSGIVLFMHQTGARRSEAVRLLGDHVDLGEGVALLERTKTENYSLRHLTTELVKRIGDLQPRCGEPVFRYTDPSAVNRAMKRVCGRAGIDVRTTHSAGRHSFGTNAMRLPGARVKAVMNAGGWKNAQLFMEIYVHDEGGREIAEALDGQRKLVDTPVTQAEPKNDYRLGKKGKSRAD